MGILKSWELGPTLQPFHALLLQANRKSETWLRSSVVAADCVPQGPDGCSHFIAEQVVQEGSNGGPLSHVISPVALVTTSLRQIYLLEK